jgi:hypothetical protein
MSSVRRNLYYSGRKMKGLLAICFSLLLFITLCTNNKTAYADSQTEDFIIESEYELTSSCLIEPEYGEDFASVSRDSESILFILKGDYWKAGYHTIETGYYTYLYGNLYLHQKPVDLYYRFHKSDEEREIKLTQIVIKESKLKIPSVSLDDEPYLEFYSEKRILYIPAGIEGEFRVTFGL